MTALLSEAPALKAFPDAPPAGPAWGDVVAWSISSVRHKHTDVLKALEDQGLDTSVLRKLLPRHAWARACKKLEDQRVIDKIDETDESIRFQFTSAVQDDSTKLYDYKLETVVDLRKADGAISCDDAAVKDRAEKALSEALEWRTSTDVTNVIQRLFEKNADLFPVREQGGCYFVPARHSAFVTKIQNFVKALGGRMNRFTIPKGVAYSDDSVQDAVVAGLQARIAEHEKAVSDWDEETRQGTIDRAVERLKVTRTKLQVYADYLGGQKEFLLGKLAEADAALVERVRAIGKSSS